MHVSKTARFSVIATGAAIPAQTATPIATPTVEISGSSGVASSEAPVDIDVLTASVTKAQADVKQLKKDGASAATVAEAVSVLEKMRAELSLIQDEPVSTFPRKAFDGTLLKKMFVVPSFEIHGGVKGLFDFGPSGCALKTNVLNEWKRHFILEENMLEMECTNLTPYNVLETSGHVEKFTDMMVKDMETGECFRADKLLEDEIDALIEASPNMSTAEKEQHQRVRIQADSFSLDEIHQLFQDYGIKGVDGHELSKPFDFNLMFATKIGPEGTSVGYLRPETAQGLFVNFKRLLAFNGQQMPFAAAQVGLSFRNEIAPRGGLLRVREFCMAEIEHFVNPRDKTHRSFETVKDKKLNLFDQESQLGSGKLKVATVGEAVSTRLINNETLGYFMARTQLFLEKIGLDPSRLRFRQHLKTEMAHYATDCWDMEIKTSYGWVECVGHADRACFDLEVHARATNSSMLAAQLLDKPMAVDQIGIELERKTIGMTFKKDQKAVVAALEELKNNPDQEAVESFQKELLKGCAELKGFSITPNMVKFTKTQKEIQEIKFLPSVIEPSFGIGRILYALMEHSFYQSPEDEQRVVMRFNPQVAPIKCCVYPLQSNIAFGPVVARVARMLTAAGLANKSDTSGQSIGRRYARSDEGGTPFGVTVDFDTLADDTVTIRERDTQDQIRVKIAEVPQLLQKLVSGEVTWGKISSTTSNNEKKKPEGGDDDDDIDLGFDDDEVEEEEKPAGKSRAEQAKELKAQRDKELEDKKAAALARLAKKEANQRSLCNLEIKPWESEQDLLELFAKIKKTVVMDGLKWSENCALVDVAFGIKKLVLTAVISLNLSMDAIIEEMTEETFVDEIQSMQMTSMSLL